MEVARCVLEWLAVAVFLVACTHRSPGESKNTTPSAAAPAPAPHDTGRHLVVQRAPDEQARLALSRNGTLIAARSSSSPCVTEIRDAGNGTIRGSLPDCARALSFGPRDATLAIGGNLWDLHAGIKLGALSDEPVEQVQWSEDGSYIAVAVYQRVDVFGATSHELVARLPGKRAVQGVAWCPRKDRPYLASWGEGINPLYLFRGGASPHSIHVFGHIDNIQAVAWSPDGSVVASSGGWILLTDAETGQSIGRLGAATDRFGSMAFSADGGKLAATDLGDNSVVVWDLATHAMHRSAPKGPEGVIGRLAWANDGRGLLGTTAYATSKFWRRSGKGLFEPIDGATFIRESAGFNSGAYSSRDFDTIAYAGSSAVLVDANGLGVFRHRKLAVEFRRTAWNDELGGFTASPDGKRVAWGSRKSIALWEPRSGTTHGALPKGQSSSDGVVWCHSSACLIIAASGSVWDTETGKRVAELPASSERQPTVSSDDQLAVIFPYHKEMAVHRVADGSLIAKLPQWSRPRSGLTGAFSPDGRWLAVSRYEWGMQQSPEVLLFDIHGRKILWSREGWYQSGGFSRDSAMLSLVTREDSVVIVDAKTGKPRFELAGCSAYTNTAWSPVAISLSRSSDCAGLQLWQGGTERPLLPPPDMPIPAGALVRDALSFNRDGTMLLSLLGIHNLANATSIVFREPGVMGAEWSPSGRWALVSNLFSGLHVIDAATGTERGSFKATAHSWLESDILLIRGEGGTFLFRPSDSYIVQLELILSEGRISTLAFTRDGRFDGPPEALTRACVRLGRSIVSSPVVFSGPEWEARHRPGLLNDLFDGRSIDAPELDHER